MHPHPPRLIIRIAPPDLCVVLRIRRHAQQIQAVQLVEHFDPDAVACLAGCGVGDFQGVGGFAEFGEVGGGDELVGYCGWVNYVSWKARRSETYDTQHPSTHSRHHP
jgi:hypothetical protein